MKQFSAETRRRMSEARKNSAAVRAIWDKQKGVPLALARRQKISRSLIGVPLTDARKKAMSVAHLTSAKASAQFAQLKRSQIGRPLNDAHKKVLAERWHEDPARRETLRAANVKASELARGKPLSLELRAKLSIAHKNSEKGKAHAKRLRLVHLGQKRPEWWKEKMREARANVVCPKFDTKIELATKAYLSRCGENIKAHGRLPGTRHQFDILIPDRRIAIECDGCYWHCCPTHGNPKHNKHAMRDSEHDAHVASLGWTMVRLWEHEINIGDFSKLDSAIAVSSQTMQ